MNVVKMGCTVHSCNTAANTERRKQATGCREGRLEVVSTSVVIVSYTSERQNPWIQTTPLGPGPQALLRGMMCLESEVRLPSMLIEGAKGAADAACEPPDFNASTIR